MHLSCDCLTKKSKYFLLPYRLFCDFKNVVLDFQLTTVYSDFFLDAFLMERIPLTRKKMPVRIKRTIR